MNAEEAFWVWWEKVEPYESQYNLRMAFEDGYRAAMKEGEND